MKTLIINGYPGKKGFTKELSKEYERVARLYGAKTNLINLYDLKFDLILHEGYKNKQKIEPDLKKVQKLILESDHLVFIYPIWWTSMPALVKGFIDRILLPGFAFKYEKGKPIGLLKEKTGEIIATGGGPKWFYRTFGRIAQIRVMGINLRFCGIKTPIKNIKTFGNVNSGSSKEYLKKIKKKVRKIAKHRFK